MPTVDIMSWWRMNVWRERTATAEYDALVLVDDGRLWRSSCYQPFLPCLPREPEICIPL